jgi:hypothetical protein
MTDKLKKRVQDKLKAQLKRMWSHVLHPKGIPFFRKLFYNDETLKNYDEDFRKKGNVDLAELTLIIVIALMGILVITSRTY